MKLKNLPLFLVLAFPQIAMATVYTVTPGDDLAAAINKLQAGDELRFSSGQYDLTTTLKINRNGTADQPIIITAVACDRFPW